MSRSAALYAKRLQFNDGVLRGLCRDVGDEDARRPHAGRSSFWWVLGHVVEHRAVPLALLGGDRSSPYPLTELFGRDTRPREDVARPSVAELTEEFARLGALLGARASELGDAAEDVEYETPARVRLPVGSFFLFHEDYHLGQLGLLRVGLGRAPLVPPRRKD